MLNNTEPRMIVPRSDVINLPRGRRNEPCAGTCFPFVFLACFWGVGGGPSRTGTKNNGQRTPHWGLAVGEPSFAPFVKGSCWERAAGAAHDLRAARRDAPSWSRPSTASGAACGT